MHLRLERLLPAPPGAVWPFLTDPTRMNRWSEATVEIVAPGDGDDPGAVGLLRRVRVPRPLGRPILLEEVIERADPPVHLVYRVVGHPVARRHRGEITLTPDGDSTRLAWEVTCSFALPGLELLAPRLLEPPLARSLDALARIVAGAPPVRFAPAPTLDEPDALPTLFAAAEAILAAQRALADRLTDEDDPKRWFSRVYEFVTDAQIRRCRDGAFSHPAWVLRLIPLFHRYYIENLEAWIAGRPCEAHWRSSFHAMENAERWRGKAGTGYAIARGMQAHIEEDLPRALAEVHHRHYKNRCNYNRFRADYLSMADLFDEAGASLLALVPKDRIPLRSRLLGALLPAPARELFMNRYFYDLPRQRRRAFDRGDRLAHFLARETG